MKYIQFLISPFVAFWNYFKDMNSESLSNGGGVSIKRNMAWGIGSLCVVVELFSLHKLPCKSEAELQFFSNICKWYVTIDMLFVLLALGVTTFEKITELIQKLKFGIVDKETTSNEIVNDKNKEISESN